MFVLLDFMIYFSAEPLETVNNRIVGGAPANITEYPWQVSLTDIRGHFCGGSIIDRRRILTAAHCLYWRANTNPDFARYLQVRVGSSNRTSGGIYKSIRKAIIHENYNRTNLDNDIAILILTNPIIYTPKSQPIALPRQDETVKVNQTVIVSGWGTQNHSHPYLPQILHSVAVDIVSQEACRRAYARNGTSAENIITDNMVCAGIENIGGKDSCQVS